MHPASICLRNCSLTKANAATKRYMTLSSPCGNSVLGLSREAGKGRRANDASLGKEQGDNMPCYYTRERIVRLKMM